MGGKGFGCAGNCHGHGRCVQANKCACDVGWSKRDRFCRLEDECDGGQGRHVTLRSRCGRVAHWRRIGSGCVLSEVGDGLCQDACLQCTGKGCACGRRVRRLR